jgi:16S rRNA (guanine966-N2)-methyltransferase
VRAQTRIAGGRYGGRRLATPNGSHTRPTSEKVRAALASSLTAADALTGARVLDLYAGSGALGLELISRGASAAVFVERDATALAALRVNVAALAGTPPSPAADSLDRDVDPPELVVCAVDVHVFVRNQAARLGPFDIVIADPPYATAADDLTGVLAGLYAAAALTRRADLVVERGARGAQWTWPEPFVGEKLRRYGDTVLCYGRAP